MCLRKWIVIICLSSQFLSIIFTHFMDYTHSCTHTHTHKYTGGEKTIYFSRKRKMKNNGLSKTTPRTKNNLYLHNSRIIFRYSNAFSFSEVTKSNRWFTWIQASPAGCLACCPNLAYCSKNRVVFVSRCAARTGWGETATMKSSLLLLEFSVPASRRGDEHRIMYENLLSCRWKCCRVWQSQSA